MQKFKLDVVWQTRRDTVYIIFFCVAPFRLEEQLMRPLIRELYNLVLDRWTIPGPGSLNVAGIERGALKIRANDLVRSFSSMSYPARHLFHVELSVADPIQRKDVRFAIQNLLIVKRKGRRRFVARLNLAAGEVNRARVQPTRRTGFETSDLEPQLLKGTA